MENNEKLDLSEVISTEQWFLQNHIVTDQVKNDIFLYGSAVHPTAIEAVVTIIDVAKKIVNYELYINEDIYKLFLLFKKKQAKKDIISLWLFKRFIKKNGNLDFKILFNNKLNHLINLRCGSDWKAEAELYPMSKYKDTTVESENSDAI